MNRCGEYSISVNVIDDGVTEDSKLLLESGFGQVGLERKVVETGEAGAGGGPAAEEDFTVATDDEDRVGFLDFGSGAGADGEFALGAMFASFASGIEGAEETGWIARGAEGGTEFHHGLVEVAGVARIEEGSGDFLEAGAGGGRLDVRGIVRKAGEDAGDIAVEGGVGELKGDAGDGGGSVVTDAGEFVDLVVSGWKSATFDDGLGGSPEVAGAGIVAEAGPGGKDFRLGGAGEVGRGGVAAEEALVIRDDGLDASLLEHDLGDEDRPGVGGAPPWKVAPVSAEPIQ